jgi:hypothetical protein
MHLGEAANQPHAVLARQPAVVFRTVVESTNGVPIVAERSMYWSLLDPMFTGSHVTMGRPQ